MASPYWFYGAGSSDPGVLSDCGRPYPSCHPLWSDAMYFSSPWRKIPGVPVSKQAPSDMQYFHLHISPNYANIAFVTSFYHNVFLKRGDRI